MSLKIVKLQGSSRSYVELDVTLNGRTLTVAPGTFCVAGQTYTLNEAQEIEVPANDFPQGLVAYLVQEKATGDVFVLADIAKYGEGYVWREGDPFRNLYCLINANIPANTQDLDDVSIEIYCRKRDEE